MYITELQVDNILMRIIYLLFILVLKYFDGDLVRKKLE